MKKHIARIHQGIRHVASKLKRSKKEEVPGVKAIFPLIDLKLKHRLLAALSYFNVLVFIPFLFGKKHSFVAYHAKQGLVLAMIWAVGALLFWLPYLGWLVVFLTLVEMIIGLINIFKGKEKPLPIIGKWAQAN